MEELKRSIPNDLKRMIHDGTPDDLPLTCSRLLDFLHTLPQFQTMIRELADPEMGLCRKSKETALDFKKKGNDSFCSGDYAEALKFYTQALRFAPAFSDGSEKVLMPILYVNRASSMHKLNLLEECKHDCDRAIVYSPFYTKAWYRRGKANASLKYFEDAKRDFEAALSMNCSIAEKRHIQGELEAVLRLYDQENRTTESRTCEINRNLVSHEHHEDKGCPVELQCVSTKTKGRGMVSRHDIPHATLIHQEEPFGAVVSKSCREAHCHFCFNDLPADTVFCSSCATPMYCSSYCQEQAGLEHNHECGGANWPVVLPSEEVMAGRIIAKLIKKSDARDPPGPIETLDLAHSYVYSLPERKLELHIYSVVLSYCLHQHFGPKFLVTEVTVSQLVVLLSQIKINSMAIVQMKFTGSSVEVLAQTHHDVERTYTSNIEQLRVGQAIYLTGRFFNHSCQPNINAYFLSRKLYLRSIEFVPAGYPLELSYGPQIGQCDFMGRQMLLKNEYSFECRCTACSEINLSDTVIHSFCCSKPDCLGAVPNTHVGYNSISADSPSSVPPACDSVIPLPASKEKQDAFKEVAPLLVEHVGVSRILPGHCLCCGSSHDLNLLNQQAEDSVTTMRKLQQACVSGNVPAASISIALDSLNCLRSIKHAYSKDVARAEDIVAETYCLMGKFEFALEHCQSSLKILKKLYNEKHIVVGNELVKLASIQLHLGDYSSAVDSIQQLEAIFSLHYGSHAPKIFKYLKCLGKQCFDNLHI